MQLRWLAVVVALIVPELSWAQTPDPGPRRDPPPHFSIAPLYDHPNRKPPQMGVPLPRIGLPLPPIGLRPPAQHQTRSRHHRGRSVTPWPVMYVMVDPYPVAVPQQPVQPVPAVEQPPSTGSLVLHVVPAATQVFVDGYYVGIAGDFGGDRGGAFLETGAHAVELVAPGYERAAFDVKIVPNQAIVYRQEMKRIEPPPPAAPSRSIPTTFYLIPGCYMGNVPPKDAGLPATCDVSRTQTFRN